MDVLYRIGNYIQYLVIICNGEIYVYMWNWTTWLYMELHNIFNQLYFNFKENKERKKSAFVVVEFQPCHLVAVNIG